MTAQNEALKFEDALELAKRGHLIARPIWDSSYGIIFYRPDDYIAGKMIPVIKSIPDRLKEYIKNESFYMEYMFTGYLCRYSDGTVINGWHPSKEDKQAHDWYVVK